MRFEFYSLFGLKSKSINSNWQLHMAHVEIIILLTLTSQKIKIN